jgi:hypothetical protein
VPEDRPGPGRRWTWRLILTPAVIAAVIGLRALADGLIDAPDPAPDAGGFSQTVRITTATGQPQTCAVTNQDTQTITLACPLHP